MYSLIGKKESTCDGKSKYFRRRTLGGEKRFSATKEGYRFYMRGPVLGKGLRRRKKRASKKRGGGKRCASGERLKKGDAKGAVFLQEGRVEVGTSERSPAETHQRKRTTLFVVKKRRALFSSSRKGGSLKMSRQLTEEGKEDRLSTRKKKGGLWKLEGLFPLRKKETTSWM